MSAIAIPASPDPQPGTTVDASHPWLGLDFFTEETRRFFYGREEEIAELARRVQRKPLTILFGQSGLGKTSILRAGLVPRLRPEGYCPVYVRIAYGSDAPSPSEQIKQAILRTTLASGAWTRTGVAVAGETLWEFLHHRDDTLRDASGRTLTPLLIFDQFEEIFTLAQSDDFGRERAAEFIQDLADLVENRAPKAVETRIEHEESSSERFDFTRCDYRILIALREDYLAPLEGLKGVMPSITQNRMRLARMNGAQALAAVLKPGGALVSEEVAEAIVRFVAGGAELANAEVEPSLLSLICRELNNARIAQGRGEISTDLLAGSHASILSEFYQRALADQPPGVHRIIEDELLTESGFRENVAAERVLKDFAAAGAAPDALATLVNRRLLRIEERLDVRRVELTHDVLCGVVGAARAARQEREARDAAERELVAQRARELATRQALARARIVAGVCAVLAIGAVGSAVFGYLNMQRARRAEARAEQVRGLAEGARIEAEKLVVYLLDDFYLELEPVGRLDVIAQLARRTLSYYEALPPSLRSSDSERNRALALVRYGAVLRSQSHTKEAIAAADQAIAMLDHLYQHGDRTEATAIGVGLGLGTRARVQSDGDDVKAAVPSAERAVAVLKPFATAPKPSVAVRRAYGLALTLAGFVTLRDNREEQAIPVLEEARATFRSIAELQMSDQPAAAGYAEASTWEVEALWAVGRRADAKRIGEDALVIVRRLLEERPGHAQALRANANITGDLALVAGEEGQLTHGLELGAEETRGWEALARLDPSNVVAWNNLAVAHLIAAGLLQSLGRPRETVAELRRALNAGIGSVPSTMLASIMRFPASWIYTLQADLGAGAALVSARAEMRKAYDRYAAEVPAGSVYRGVNQVYADETELVVRQLHGEHAAVLRQAPELAVRTAALAVRTASERFLQHQALRDLRDVEAESAYAVGDYARAAASGRAAIENAIAMKPRKVADLRALDDERAKLALALARLGRNAEAQQLIAPVLKRERALLASIHEDQALCVEVARALLASAAAQPASGTAELEEAARLVAGVPADMRRLASVAVWRERIDAELKTRR